ncbi:hypothetical protein GCM10023175_41090 [Pseudonocardia xishanensis]|uniref:Tyr recombinase domain-containing protein n=1 Tax=Pseudonocardia xishanensis TaxID=630995 RepID=A0ABP8RV78_9PSEU
MFVRVHAPHRELTTGGVTMVVFDAAQRAGLGRMHAHRLRHTAATAMLQAGSPLGEVGQVLRHRSVLTTAFLEKVDFADDGTGNARRLYPLGRTVPVVPDPDHGFGEPTLTSGARTETVAELVAAGESRERVAAVYDIGVGDITAAVRYGHDRVA